MSAEQIALETIARRGMQWLVQSLDADDLRDLRTLINESLGDRTHVYVRVSFPDSEARYASRISAISVSRTPFDGDDETEYMIEAILDGPAVTNPDDRIAAVVVCALCGDEIHQPSDAFPDDRRWFDSSGDPTCPDRLRTRPDGAIEGLPHVPKANQE